MPAKNPYKKTRAPRATYKEIREARPAQAMSRKAMMDFIEACKLKNCVVQELSLIHI